MNMLDLVAASAPAVEFERDWTVWWWIGAIVVGLAAIAIAAAFLPLWEAMEDRGAHIALVILLGLSALASAVVLLVLPGTMMRHIVVHENVWWIAVPFLVAALGFVWLGLGRLAFGWAGYVPAVLIVLGVGIGAGYDALNRLASWIPTTVGALVLLGIAIVAILIAKVRE